MEGATKALKTPLRLGVEEIPPFRVAFVRDRRSPCGASPLWSSIATTCSQALAQTWSYKGTASCYRYGSIVQCFESGTLQLEYQQNPQAAAPPAGREPLADRGGAAPTAPSAGQAIGYGRSLVYYAVKRAPTFNPGFWGDLEVQLKSGHYLLCGASLIQTTYRIERGYDRYDALQKLDETPFVRSQNFSPYLGWRFELDKKDDPEAEAQPEILLYGGPIFSSPAFASSAAGTTLKNRGWGVRFGIAVGLRYLPGPQIQAERRNPPRILRRKP